MRLDPPCGARRALKPRDAVGSVFQILPGYRLLEDRLSGTTRSTFSRCTCQVCGASAIRTETYVWGVG